MPEFWPLVIPAFIAGFLTFLAPCTLPLVPAFLVFIGGTSSFKQETEEYSSRLRRKVFLNAIFYVIGFSFVFIFFGMLFGLGGSVLSAHRTLLTQIGGIFVIFFALFLFGVFKSERLFFLKQEHRLSIITHLEPGKPISSFIFGATFAFGWTPCIGPILGSIFLLAASSATLFSGAVLLAVFSFGLGLPFLIIAAGYGQVAQSVKKLQHFFPKISFVSGLFLLFMGILLVLNKMDIWLKFVYQWLNAIPYESLTHYF